jgi:DNA helicase HerA-like ATPase
VTKTERVALFGICFLLLSLVFYIFHGSPLPSSIPGTVIFAALLMLAFVTLFLEHFFVTPTDVLASTIAILLLLSPLRENLTEFGIWYDIFYWYNLILAICALTALLLLSESAPQEALRNLISFHLKRFSIHFGNGRWLFTALFFLTLLFYVDSQSWEFLVLSAFAAVSILINPRQYIFGLFRREPYTDTDIGQVIGVQSRNIFLAKLFETGPEVRRFDLVEFSCSMDSPGNIRRGLIIDSYVLSRQHWVKILCAEEIRGALQAVQTRTKLQTNVVYRLVGSEVPGLLDRFVGVVGESSTIQKIRFEYAGRIPVFEGDLLGVSFPEGTVLYQIVQGVTDFDTLEAKDKAGLIYGEAVQLGTWNADRVTFEKYGWVPAISTPVFLAPNIEPVTPQEGEIRIGSIPNTNYPVLMNLDEAITHHLALLGVTGSGKSVFARNLIRRIVLENVKVICVDFTNEYRAKFPDLQPQPIIPENMQDDLFKAIDRLSVELAEFKNRQDAKVIEDNERILRGSFVEAIRNFLASDQQMALFELPDVENTTGILEYTKWFFRSLFQIARREGNLGKKICVVLEEAHTVIPEWNFIGVDEKKAQSLVNSIGQIALQGRKYRIGFVVIAQRTANVSKTVLTQCNSVVAFQQFDKTSCEFLENYMGTEMTKALSTLQPRQAIAVGKAFRSGVPLIFRVPDILEP